MFAQYNDETATTLARQLLDGATDETRIAVVSAPSAFIQLKNLLVSANFVYILVTSTCALCDVQTQTDLCQASGEYQCRPQIKLLEIDERFGVFKEFVHYDFEHPTRLPIEMKGTFDRIICDPPFLSQDCQTKGQNNILTFRNITTDCEQLL